MRFKAVDLETGDVIDPFKLDGPNKDYITGYYFFEEEGIHEIEADGTCEGHFERYRIIWEPSFESERASTIQLLRGACRQFGDNDWDDDLHLVDIIEKHLLKHLGL